MEAPHHHAGMPASTGRSQSNGSSGHDSTQHGPGSSGVHGFHRFVISMPEISITSFISDGAMPASFISPASIFSSMMSEHGGVNFVDPIFSVLQASFNHANRSGAHPPSTAALESVFHLQLAEKETFDCPITAEAMLPGQWASRMPCGHYFSKDALDQWLAQHNTCPVCRYELHTDDEEYNREHNLLPENAAEAALRSSCRSEDYIKRRIDGLRESNLMQIVDGVLDAINTEDCQMLEMPSCKHAISGNKDQPERNWDQICDDALAEFGQCAPCG